MTDGGLRFAVWAQGEPSPRPSTALGPGDLALDRDLFAVQDNSLSRAANAPRLVVEPGTPSAIAVLGTSRSIRQPLVMSGAVFLTFQGSLSLSLPTVPWKVRPAEISEPGRLVSSPRGSVVLLRSLAPAPGVSHYLRTLPPVRTVAPGETLPLVPPVVLVLGDGALELRAEDTGVPPPPPTDTLIEKLAELDLDPVIRRMELPDRLESLKGETHGVFQLPLSNTPDPEPFEAARFTASRLLHARGTRFLFFPVIQDERFPRLGAAYLPAPTPEPGDAAELVVSGPDPAELIQAMRALLDARPSRSPRAISVPPPSAAAFSTEERPAVGRFGEIETANPDLARALEQAASVAPGEMSVLFLGESGTGKEHLARELHRGSLRHRGPFVAVNCAAIAPNLVGSELFGHVAGAFTGASQTRQGAFAAAEGGTLLLDEIGDAPLEVQLSLLRAIETRLIRPVGADHDRAVNVRVLAATSRKLEEMMDRGAFREDLYYRLAELVVKLPPLRERREDLPALVRTLLHAVDPRLALTESAMRALLREPLRGNVRELRNLLRKGAAFAKNGLVDAAALELGERRAAGTADPVVVKAMVTAVLGPQAEGSGGRGGAGDGGDDGSRRRGGADAPLETLPGVTTQLVFPRPVALQAAAIWRAGTVVETEGGSDDTRYEARAKTRAALLCLRAQYPLEVWPGELARHYERLFGARWATSEGGRGVKDVMRVLGYDVRNEDVKRWVVEVG